MTDELQQLRERHGELTAELIRIYRHAKIDHERAAQLEQEILALEAQMLEVARRREKLARAALEWATPERWEEKLKEFERARAEREKLEKELRELRG